MEPLQTIIDRSFWSVTRREIYVAILTVVSGVGGFYLAINKLGYFMAIYTCSPLEACCGDGLNCDTPEKPSFFLTFVIPYACILAISSVSVIRALWVDIREFSDAGLWAMAYPLITILPGFIFTPLILFLPCSWPFTLGGMVLALAASIRSLIDRKNYGNFWAVAMNLAVLGLEWFFAQAWGAIVRW